MKLFLKDQKRSCAEIKGNREKEKEKKKGHLSHIETSRKFQHTRKGFHWSLEKSIPAREIVQQSQLLRKDKQK